LDRTFFAFSANATDQAKIATVTTTNNSNKNQHNNRHHRRCNQKPQIPKELTSQVRTGCHWGWDWRWDLDGFEIVVVQGEGEGGMPTATGLKQTLYNMIWNTSFPLTSSNLCAIQKQHDLRSSVKMPQSERNTKHRWRSVDSSSGDRTVAFFRERLGVGSCLQRS
jgi:hypothetical protein